MKPLHSVTLYRGDGSWIVRERYGERYLCYDKLNRHISIPKEATKLYVSVYGEPIKGNHVIKLTMSRDGGMCNPRINRREVCIRYIPADILSECVRKITTEARGTLYVAFEWS